MSSNTVNSFWDVETAYLNTHISSPPELVTPKYAPNNKKTPFWEYIDLYDPDFQRHVDEPDEEIRAIDEPFEPILCTDEPFNTVPNLPYEVLAMIILEVAKSADEEVDDGSALTLPSAFFAIRRVSRLWNEAVLSTLTYLIKKDGHLEFARYTRLCLPLRQGHTLQGLVQTLRAAPPALLSTITTLRWYRTQDVGLSSFESTYDYMAKNKNDSLHVEYGLSLADEDLHTHCCRKWNEYVSQFLRERSLLSGIRDDDGRALSHMLSLFPHMSIFESHTSTIWPTRDWSDLKVSQKQLQRELGTLLPLLINVTTNLPIQSLHFSTIETRALEYIPSKFSSFMEHITSISFGFAPVQLIRSEAFHKHNGVNTPYTADWLLTSNVKLSALLAAARNLKSLALWWHDPYSLLPMHGSMWLANVLDRQHWPCLEYFSIESIPSPAAPLLRILSAHKQTLHGVCFTNVETLEDTLEEIEAQDRLILETRRLKLEHAVFGVLTYEACNGRVVTSPDLMLHFYCTRNRELAALAERPDPNVASNPPIEVGDLLKKLNRWLRGTDAETRENELLSRCAICRKNAQTPNLGQKVYRKWQH